MIFAANGIVECKVLKMLEMQCILKLGKEYYDL